MTPQPAPALGYTLLRFTLIQTSGGLPTQRRELLGCFAEAESAFASAKQGAWNALCKIAQNSRGANSAAPGAELRVCDTEWGYDVRHDGQIVDRFWVHDRHPRQAL